MTWVLPAEKSHVLDLYCTSFCNCLNENLYVMQ